MRSVGEILKKTRIEKNLTLGEIEAKIRIRSKFLQALEENDYSKLPSSVYIRGFLKNYSDFLGLPTERIMAIFRRQFDERKNLGLLPKGLTGSVKGESLRLKTPSAVFFLFLIPLVLLFAYLFREYRSFVQPPSLSVQSPQEQAVISGGIVEVSGQTDSSATLMINGQKIFLAPDGSFSQNITLSPGLNTLDFVARNKLGKETIVKRMVKLNP